MFLIKKSPKMSTLYYLSFNSDLISRNFSFSLHLDWLWNCAFSSPVGNIAIIPYDKAVWSCTFTTSLPPICVHAVVAKCWDFIFLSLPSAVFDLLQMEMLHYAITATV
jgi:hypothetical protein